ncbi:Uncharacterized protein BCRIVMBC845_06489 [Bacillus cereus]|nr:Uncharacterized protein BCRIVMBC845_06489 [Bacillus cereus]
MDIVLQFVSTYGFEIAKYLLPFIAVKWEYEYINEDGKKKRRFKIASRFSRK